MIIQLLSLSSQSWCSPPVSSHYSNAGDWFLRTDLKNIPKIYKTFKSSLRHFGLSSSNKPSLFSKCKFSVQTNLRSTINLFTIESEIALIDVRLRHFDHFDKVMEFDTMLQSENHTNINDKKLVFIIDNLQLRIKLLHIVYFFMIWWSLVSRCLVSTGGSKHDISLEIIRQRTFYTGNFSQFYGEDKLGFI